MKHTYELSGDIGILAIKGELTIAHADELKSIFVRRTAEIGKVVVRFEDITDVDLSCLQMLCSVHRTLTKNNKSMRMEGKGVRRILRMAKKAGYYRNACCRPDFESTCLWTEGIL